MCDLGGRDALHRGHERRRRAPENAPDVGDQRLRRRAVGALWEAARARGVGRGLVVKERWYVAHRAPPLRRQTHRAVDDLKRVVAGVLERQAGRRSGGDAIGDVLPAVLARLQIKTTEDQNRDRP